MQFGMGRSTCTCTGARILGQNDFQKGDATLCDNYCPISLLAVGYKLFAAIILKSEGFEASIRNTQYGFRS